MAGNNDIYCAIEGVLVYSAKIGIALPVRLRFGHIFSLWKALSLWDAKLSTLRGQN